MARGLPYAATGAAASAGGVGVRRSRRPWPSSGVSRPSLWRVAHAVAWLAVTTGLPVRSSMRCHSSAVRQLVQDRNRPSQSGAALAATKSTISSSGSSPIARLSALRRPAMLTTS